MAPSGEIARGIRDTVTYVQEFADKVLGGQYQGSDGPFRHLVHIGIGGSTLGPQLVSQAFSEHTSAIGKKRPLTVHFLDNADPHAVDALIQGIDGRLGNTLVSVVSKCGWTPTPRYLLQEMEAAYSARGLHFRNHAVATTVPGSELHRYAESEGWLAIFPIWDWIGGRLSVTSAVGLLPAAIRGIDIHDFLEGASAMDRSTRRKDPRSNPAALLALMWYWLGEGKGNRNMAVVPYRDCLGIFARYVQQLVMESVGKKLDRSGKEVLQGLTVFGNKGTTDQHSYFQQLREGRNDFFAVLIGVREDRRGKSFEIEPDVTLGDYLFSSLEGSRNALYERGRDSITISMAELRPATLGALIALFERAVEIYAELININAYHQPGVDKRVGDPGVALQRAILAHLRFARPAKTADQIAEEVGAPDDAEMVFKILARLSEQNRGIRSTGRGFDMLFEANEPERN